MKESSYGSDLVHFALYFQACNTAYMHPVYYVVDGDSIVDKWIPNRGWWRHIHQQAEIRKHKTNILSVNLCNVTLITTFYNTYIDLARPKSEARVNTLIVYSTKN